MDLLHMNVDPTAIERMLKMMLSQKRLGEKGRDAVSAAIGPNPTGGHPRRQTTQRKPKSTSGVDS